jgi:hypothetical protein
MRFRDLESRIYGLPRAGWDRYGLLSQGYHALRTVENRFVCYNMRTARSGRLTQR